MRLDLFVHRRLSHRGLICLIVATPPITDEINDNILVEMIAVIHGQLRHEDDRLGVIAVNVKNGRLHHFCNVRAVLRGARVLALTGGESNLIIQHDVQCAAGTIGPGLGHLKRFHDDALARKGRVAMNDDWHHRLTKRIFTAILSRAYGAFYHRRHNFQMRGVEGQRQVHFTTRGHHVRRKALVILHVT